MGPRILEPPEEGFQILQCHERRWCSDFLDDWWSDLATSTVERSRMVATEFSTERSGQLGAPPGRGRSELAGFRVARILDGGKGGSFADREPSGDAERGVVMEDEFLVNRVRKLNLGY